MMQAAVVSMPSGQQAYRSSIPHELSCTDVSQETNVKGQTATWRQVLATSALPLKADFR